MKIELLKGNCLELMKNLPDESIDMILADPPYGTTRNKWDSVIPLDKMWEQFRRVAKKNAAICIFSQMPFTAELVNSNRKDFRYEWIWQKPQGTGFLNANRMPMKAHENICVFYRAMPTYIPQYTWGGVSSKIIMPLAITTEIIIRWLRFRMAEGFRQMFSGTIWQGVRILRKSQLIYLNI